MDNFEVGMGDQLQPALEKVAKVARDAKSIVVSTGAGVSAESGVPTFRDAQTGLWAKYDPVMLASYEGFCDDPAQVWQWYDWRRQNMAKCEPNPGHHTLAEWEEAWGRAGRSFKLVTQNIDNLHAKAGSKNITELHGNIWRVRPLHGRMADSYYFDECPLKECPPKDAEGRMLRPHVVWFGEMLDPANLDAAFEAVAKCDLLMVVGTSATVYPAAALPHAALRAGAAVVEINPNETELSSYATHCLFGNSGEVLPKLWELVHQG